jgi:GH15 family glucan-1,4-alpha-glucosidase
VIAEARLGRRQAAEARLLAIFELAGPPAQLSEVALPSPPTLLGNYPQVQSHAALVEAILELYGDS